MITPRNLNSTPRPVLLVSVGPKQSTRRGQPIAIRVISIRHPYPSLIRRVLRTRYAAPIGIVDTSGGLAGFVLPFSNVLREDFRLLDFLLELSRRSRDS